MNSQNRCFFVAAFVSLTLASVGAAYGQLYTVNSAVISPRVFNDIPGATLTTTTTVNNYPSVPSLISFSEQNVSAPSGFANRDIWQFSNDGSSAYTLGAADTAFTATFTLNLSPDTGSSIDNEAGWIIQNANGSFPGGDMQFIAKASGDYFVGFFGGPGFWNSGMTYVAGTPITMTVAYWQTGATGNMQFSATYNSSTVTSPVESWTGNLVGDTVGGYFQIQNDSSNASNSAQATFSNIGITPVPEPSMLAFLGLGLFPLIRRFRRCA